MNGQPEFSAWGTGSLSVSQPARISITLGKALVEGASHCILVYTGGSWVGGRVHMAWSLGEGS